MSDDVLLRDCDRRGVLRLTLNRAGSRNALDAALIAALTEAFQDAAHDAAVRVVVLAGAGPVFCAGADFGWLKRALDQDAAENEADSQALAALYRAAHACPRPVVARVQGGAWAGGCTLIATCDVVVAETQARFAITEARLGLTPSLMVPYLLGRIGPGRVRRYCLTGETIDAATARRIGLVDTVVDTVVDGAELDATVGKIVDALLHCAPDALAETKALVEECTRPPADDAATALALAAFAAGRAGDEAREGLAARAEKRLPRWAAGGAGG